MTLNIEPTEQNWRLAGPESAHSIQWNKLNISQVSWLIFNQTQASMILLTIFYRMKCWDLSRNCSVLEIISISTTYFEEL